jgi:hypothetical protein
MSWLLYDIANETFLRGRALASRDNHRAVEGMYATLDDGRREKVLRSIKRGVAALKRASAEYLSAYSEEGRVKSEENSELRGETIEADNGGMSAEGSLVFEFRMPGNYADGATAELCEGMHEYLKDVAISDWYGVTNPADSERYMVLASSALQGVVAALGSRLRPMRRKEGSV